MAKGHRWNETDAEALQLRISAQMDRAAVEALQLEIRRLAERHGIEVRAVRITRDDSGPPEEPDTPPESAESP